MLTVISSFVASDFVVEYFKDMFLALLVVFYFAVLTLMRLRILMRADRRPAAAVRR